MKSPVKTPVDMMMDVTMQSLNTMAKASEQSEEMVLAGLEQSKKMRAEGELAMERFVEQIKASQAESQKLIDSSFKASLDAIHQAQQHQLDFMHRQMEMMQAQMASFNSFFQAAISKN